MVPTGFSMKQIIRLCVVPLAAIVVPGNASPQSLGASTAANSKILTYISSGWNTLSRSMTDCKSLVDPKVTTAPVLYLPAGMEMPSAVSTAHQQCNVEIKQLPRKITHIGDVGVAEIPVEGLLY